MIDQRAFSNTKIVPPIPLPYVSRGALKRVLNPMPIPSKCRYCNGVVVLSKNNAIYNRSYGKWPYMYLCVDCKAYVGLHPGTDIPLGTLANSELRKLRNDAKGAFHLVKDKSGAKRKDVYRWLAWEMDVSVEDCHFAWFDNEECITAKAICDRELKGELHG